MFNGKCGKILIQIGEAKILSTDKNQGKIWKSVSKVLSHLCKKL
jgi:hypothetical protein